MVNKRKIRRRRAAINIKPIKADKQPGLILCEKHFWIFAFGIILILILTSVFDFSLKPASYKGLFINRPYYGLHSWANANRAWAARNHVKYGLVYTRGYHTLAVGDPPPKRHIPEPEKLDLQFASLSGYIITW